MPHTIFLVDDSRAMQAIIRRSLAGGGFADATVRGFSNGADLMAHMAQEQPDLLITD